MSLRKSFYFKPLCLLVAALFTSQCITYERKLVSTEEKVIENGIQAYILKVEKVKNPSTQDPTVEYKIAKFPANRVESIKTYKLRKVDRSLIIFGGFVVGAAAGFGLGQIQVEDPCQDFGKPIVGSFIGSIIGALAGIGAGTHMGIKSDLKGLIRESVGNHLQRKSDSISIPVQDFPLELVWGTASKHSSFKTRTDDQGIVRINLIDDLKITKFPPVGPLNLFIHYFDPDSQVKEILVDPLILEK